MTNRLLIGAAFLAVAAGASASFYQYDDGVSDTSLQTSGSNLNCIFLTQFTVAAGGQTVNSIDVVWGGRTSTNTPNGIPVQVLLMNDPNNDGNPNDSTVVRSVSTVTVNGQTDIYNNYAITPVTMGVGTNFFVGAYFPNMPNNMNWIALDGNATGMATKSWWQPQGIPGSTSYFSMSIFGNDYTCMVRANVAGVPEPATLTALALGGVALIRRRKKS
jgi:hypothetical protein